MNTIKAQYMHPNCSTSYNTNSNTNSNTNTKQVGKNYTFCNNCGKGGHQYHQCKMPITSIGIITVRSNNGVLEYLLIRRKDTLGYIDFLRGKFNLNSKSHIMNLLNEMTNHEKTRILSNDFHVLWADLWGNDVGIQYRNEEQTSADKFNMLKSGVMIDDEVYNISKLIDESTDKWTEPEWGFPKGRRNYQERDYECAVREWEEETGYSRDKIKILNNVVPYEEIFTGSNYKSYKHKYYLSIYFGDIDTIPCHFQQTEIGDARWMSYVECVKHIRNYNLEKLDMFKKVNKVFTNYRIY